MTWVSSGQFLWLGNGRRYVPRGRRKSLVAKELERSRRNAYQVATRTGADYSTVSDDLHAGRWVIATPEDFEHVDFGRFARA